MESQSILLVEKELLSRDLLSSHLKQAGFKVLAAEDAAGAALLVGRQRIRLAILGSRLGERELDSLAARLRRLDADALVFLLADRPASCDLEALGRRGLHDVIFKPFRLDEVSLKLRHAVELLSLREGVRALGTRLRRCQQDLERLRIPEREIPIPDLSAVELEEEGPAGETPQAAEAKPRDAGVPERREPRADSAPPADAIEQIRRLDELRQSGIITDSEFSAKKRELLRRV